MGRLGFSPQIAAVVPLAICTKFNLILTEVGTDRLEFCVSDEKGEAEARRLGADAEFLSDLSSAVGIPREALARRQTKVNWRSVAEVQDAIRRIHGMGGSDLERHVRWQVVSTVPRRVAEERRFILLRVSPEGVVDASAVDGKAEMHLRTMWRSSDFRKKLAKAGGLENPERAAGETLEESTMRLQVTILRNAQTVAQLIESNYPSFGPQGTGLTSVASRQYSERIREEYRPYSRGTGEVTLKTDAELWRMFENFLATGLELGGSDVEVYFNLERKELRWGIFIDGDWVPQTPVALDSVEVFQALVGMTVNRCEIASAEHWRPRGGDLTVERSEGKTEKKFYVRMAIFPITDPDERRAKLHRLVGRVLRTQTSLRSVEELGLGPYLRKTFDSLCDEPAGLILIVGPMNSGKSETSQVLCKQVKTKYPGKSIVAVANPIEVKCDFMHQTEVAVNQNMEPADYVPLILRLNAQMVSVAEIGDPRMALLALLLAQSGHLTVSTIHALDPFETINRLIKLGVTSDMIAGALRAVLSQRLVPRLCPDCSVYRPVNELLELDEFTILQAVFEHWRMDIKSFRPKRATGMVGGSPCPRCSGRGNPGFTGRIGVFEIWRPRAQRRQLFEEASVGEIRETALLFGHRTLWRSAIRHAQEGLIDIVNAKRFLGEIDPSYEGLPGFAFKDLVAKAEAKRAQEEAAAAGFAIIREDALDRAINNTINNLNKMN